MFGRENAGQPVAEPTVEALEAEATTLAEQLAEERRRRDEARQELEKANDLGRRAELRETIERSDSTIGDGEERHGLLLAQRDRLVRDLKLAKLDPLRAEIVEVDREAQALRVRLDTVERQSAEKKRDLADREDEILHPTLSASEKSEVDWLIRQWMNGGIDVAVHLGQMPRRLAKAAQARMAAIGAGAAGAVDEHRRRARQSWEDAGVPLWERPEPVDVPEVEVPQPEAPPLPYGRVG